MLFNTWDLDTLGNIRLKGRFDRKGLDSGLFGVCDRGGTLGWGTESQEED